MSDLSSVRSSEIKIANNDDRCAPGIDFNSMSCIKLGLLIKLANAYNEYTSETSKLIKLSSNLETLNPPKYKKYLVREIQTRIGNKCTTQQCWSEQTFVDKMDTYAQDELKKYTFRPEGPNGKFEWLNTYNIDNVMTQYESKYKDFKFLGTVPMDFDDISRLGIKHFDYAQSYNSGKTKIGFVFNLDESWKSGSHWVSMFANLKEKNVFYFDSYGIAPEPRVRRLMRRIEKAIQTITPGSNVRADYNKERHQYKNSECGVYSINFIIRMLRGDNFDKLCSSKINDDEINKCRKSYFSNT
jgi:hypothetical protein